MRRSRWTLATIDAAPMVMLFASPLMIACCGICRPLSLRLVVSLLDPLGDGAGARARVELQRGEAAARQVARFVAEEPVQLGHGRPAKVLGAHRRDSRTSGSLRATCSFSTTRRIPGT